MRDFRTLKVWRKGHELTLAVYKMTARFPKEELYGLTSQLRRACTSIAGNIAEGCGRSGSAELTRFLRISMGSASEVEYLLLLAHDLGFLPADQYEVLAKEVTDLKRMLTSLVQKVKE